MKLYWRRFINWLYGGTYYDANRLIGVRGGPGPIPEGMWRPQRSGFCHCGAKLEQDRMCQCK